MKRQIVLIMFMSLILTGCAQEELPYNFENKETNEISVNKQDNRVIIVTDKKTGCQYIAYDYNGTAITPRMDKDGKQVCGEVNS